MDAISTPAIVERGCSNDGWTKPPPGGDRRDAAVYGDLGEIGGATDSTMTIESAVSPSDRCDSSTCR